jgi:hypothetical protein
MGCTVKVATRVLPPVIVELAQGSKEKYSVTATNPEVHFGDIILVNGM